ncbi:ATP-binding protein [Nesterenkonia xinjiangensis]|uniref:Phage shock protein PspC (Stress-responsive transcriptional regulator)/two-component sensor histidine kinase n=1 Tax=Nesterenkonia xinjiangensis TaxID=225327 RepID=A0A7Z0GK17_9MICC|nr:ATP-binding protein [Nesterenkonia xinjiangensis]NYJ77415.1 phage shock protein PspC (stress-responsive transcriptional regulator)/two-component sensor histidine kinase [Nesterenkonia xinjiangensis]
MVTETERPPLRRGVGTPVAGVCLGVSRHLGVSLPVVRAVMIGLAIAGGVGILLYCWLWIFVPSEQEPEASAGVRGLSGPAVEGGGDPSEGSGEPTSSAGEDPGARIRRILDSLTSSPEVLLGGLLLGAAALLALSLAGVPLNWRLFGPPAVLVVGVLLAWSQVDKTGRGGTDHGTLWQIVGGAGLVVVALLVIAGGILPGGDLLLGLIVAMMLLAGIALVIAPWLIRLYRTASTERTRAAAEAERADIAAHLHDSVLQTLAMIQKQRQDPAAVERLARSQERQLRGWLYRQQEHESGTLKDRLSATAAELEEMHDGTVEVVAVGESRRQDHRALVGAAREAIVNSLKHAGPASVYVESDATQDAVFVRDRGPGFELDGIEEDRLGVRESIIGRMRRAGGEARIRSNGRGTEVQLFMPVDAAGEEENGHE